MKFSVNWLREFVNPGINNTQLVEQLTMAGLEVESLTPAISKFSNVFTAKVLAVKKHPDAERLKVCDVEYNNQVLNIVCGAPNVAAGMTVALAINGASLQNGAIKIKNSKIRGVESQGMLCSPQELGFADSTAQGIWDLGDAVPLNVDLYEYLKLDDEIIELSLTPNRGDCLSIRGVAREVASLNNMDESKINPVEIDTGLINSKLDANLKFKINILAKQACPRYCGRIIKGLDANAITPIWMQERLRRAGQRSIYPLVDVTNFVMLELGQPMHAFDLNKINDEINVRFANLGTANETLVLLDGTELKLANTDLVICDKNKPLALAGIKGGLESGITNSTTDIFLESAFFTPDSVIGKARKYNISSDGSQRWERGVDPMISKLAIERATTLLLQIAGTANTVVSNIQEDVNNDFFKTKEVRLRHNRIKRVLGIELESNQVKSILTNLGLKLVENSNAEYIFAIPSHRFDLNIEEDLLEELARSYGYDNIPNNIPVRSLDLVPAQPEVLLAKNIRNILMGRGYLETVNYSFIDDTLQTDFNPRTLNDHSRGVIKLVNPISSEMSELRQSLCPGLLKIAEYNFNHQVDNLKLYEIGKCFYLNSDNTISEEVKLAGLIAGNTGSQSWHNKATKVDFFDAKADLEVLFAELNLSHLSFCSKDWVEQNLHKEGMNIGYVSCLGTHPGQSALITCNNKVIGWVGKLHPQVSKKTDIDNSVILFELSLEELEMPSYNCYNEISKMPSIRRDLAFLLKQDVTAQQLFDVVKSTVGGLLKNMEIFDVYQGDSIPQGHKSLAFSMVLQDNEKTLVDDEIVAVINKVVDVITNKFAGQLRE